MPSQPEAAQPPITHPPGAGLIRISAAPLIAFLLMATLGLGGIGVYTLSRLHQTAREGARQTLTTLVELKRQQIESLLATQRKDLELFADHQSGVSRAITAWQTGGQRDAGMYRFFHERLKEIARFHRYPTIALFDASGKPPLVIGDSDPSRYAAVAQASIREKATRFVDLHQLPDGRIEFGFVAPVSFGDQPAGAALYFGSNAAELLHPLVTSQPAQTDTAESYLVRRENETLLFLSPLKHQADAPLRLAHPVAAATTAAAHAVRGHSGFLEATQGYRNQPVLAYVAEIAGTQWRLVTELDASKADARPNTTVRVTAASMTLGLLLVYALAFQYWRLHIRQRQMLEMVARLDEQQHAARLAELANGVKAILWELDPVSETITSISDSVETLLGHPPAYWVGHATWLDHTLPEDRESLIDGIRRALQGQPVSLEYRMLTATGQMVWFEDRFELAADRTGKPLLRGVMHDITERKQVEVSLALSRGRYRELVERIPVGVYTLRAHAGDASITFEYLSDRLTEIAGLDKAAAMGDATVAFGLVVPEDRERLETANQQAFTTGQPFFFEGRFMVRDAIRWLRMDSTPTFLPNGDSLWNGVVMDITASKAVKTQLQEEIAARRERETDIERLNRLYATLAQVNQSLLRASSRDRIFEDICRIHVETGQAAMAWVGWLDPETRRVSPIAAFGDATGYLDGIVIYADDRPEGNGPTGRALRENRPIVCADFLLDPTTLPWRAAAERAGWACSGSFPIHRDGAVAGAFTLYGHQPDIFGNQEVELLAQSAANISFALDAMDRDERRRYAEQEIGAAANRYRRILATAKDGFWQIDPVTGRILDANQAALDMTGYTREELLAMRIPDVDVEQTPEEAQAHRVRNKIHGWDLFESRHRRKDGSLMDVEVSTTYDTDDQTCLAFVRDITGRKAAEQAIHQLNDELEQRVEQRTAELVIRSRELQESEARFRLAMDASNDGLWDWRIDTNEVYYSPGYFKMLGHAPGDFASHVDTWLSLLHPADREWVNEEARARIQAMGQYEIEFRMQARDGSYRWILSRGQVVERDATGEPRRIVGTHIDITERKQAELAVKESESRYRELNATLEDRVAQRTAQFVAASEAKSRFLAHMSHEIRTPMNAILGLSQVLERDSLSVGQREIVERIGNAGESLLHVINDILDFSKIEAGQMTVEQRPFALDDVLARVTNLMTPAAEAKGVRFTVQPLAGVAGPLVSDPLRLEQVLTNLCNNAIKFTEHGQVEIRVNPVAVTADSARLRFEVRDTGIGITAAALEDLFQPFTQADTSITRRFGGTGLGLAICKRLVDLMGGDIGASSVHGQGSCFWFELPFGRTESGATPLVPTTSAPTAPKGHRLAGLRVLVVDDNPMNRFLVERALELEGATGITANDGQQALDRLQAQPGAYDVVLMDIQMPVLDGLAATRAIRADPQLRNLPVIAFTAGVLAEERSAALAAGVNDFLPKPVDLEQLTAVLRPYLTAPTGIDPTHNHHNPAPPNSEENMNDALNSTPPAAPPATRLGDLPGVNLDPVLEMIGGDEALLGQLLEGFIEEFGNLPEEVGQALERGETDAVARRLHSFKGTAANLGLTDLSQKAVALEMAVKAGQSTAALLADLAETHVSLLPALRQATQPG